VENYGRAGQVTNDNITRCMSFVCRITNATLTRSEYVILTAFVGSDVQANTPQYNVTRTLSVFVLIQLNVLTPSNSRTVEQIFITAVNGELY